MRIGWTMRWKVRLKLMLLYWSLNRCCIRHYQCLDTKCRLLLSVSFWCMLLQTPLFPLFAYRYFFPHVCYIHRFKSFLCSGRVLFLSLLYHRHIVKSQCFCISSYRFILKLSVIHWYFELTQCTQQSTSSVPFQRSIYYLSPFYFIRSALPNLKASPRHRFPLPLFPVPIN